MKKERLKHHKYLWSVVFSGILCLGIGLLEGSKSNQSEGIYMLERNHVGGGEKEIILSLEADDLPKGYTYPITIKEQQLTETEAQQLLKEAEQELETVILGSNTSLMKVSDDLYLPEYLQDGAVSVDCYFEPYEMVDTQGVIQWENYTEDNSLVKVRAELSCQEYEAEYEFYLQLEPKELNRQEKLLKEVQKSLAVENAALGKRYIQLPRELAGTKLYWKMEKESTALQIFALSIAGILVCYVCTSEKEKRRKKERIEQLTRDYPDIVNQLSLLTGAGMTVAAAWVKISATYEKQRAEGRVSARSGYEEMQRTWHEIQDGMGELQAYENFGARCGLPQYRKFASILTQNIRKGSSDMQRLLDAESREAFLQRKAFAKQQGEEAGTKLLLPMGIMLILVFIILLLPAMWNMQL